MTIASWENLVETIDTIERGEEGDLYVYFKMSVILSYFRFLDTKHICRKHSDVRMREVSRLCAQKFPQKVCCENLASGQYVADLICQAHQVLRIQSAMEDRRRRYKLTPYDTAASNRGSLFCFAHCFISFHT